MIMKHKIVFVACDTSNIKKIKKILHQTNNNKVKIIPKFGIQFFLLKKWQKIFRKI